MPQADVDFQELYRRLEDAESRLSRPLDAHAQRNLLDKRTAEIARKAEREKPDELSVLGFHLGQERYAVRTEDVEQVMTSRGLSALAGPPRHVGGAAVVRSRIVPVLDLRHLLGRTGD